MRALPFVVALFLLSGCGSTLLSAINPLNDNGTKVTAQVGKNNSKVDNNAILQNNNSTKNNTDIVNKAGVGTQVLADNQKTLDIKNKGNVEKQNIADNQNNANIINQITQQIPREVLIGVLILIVIIIFLAGWAIPPPGETYQAIRGLIADIYKGTKLLVTELYTALVKGPLKGTFDFITILIRGHPDGKP